MNNLESSNNIILPEVNENTYELILNTFLIYYKKIYKTENIKTMFDNIKQEGDTNKQLELFYQSLIEFNVSKFDTALDYTEENKNNDDLYILTVNDKPIKICDNIIMLLIEVINNNYTEWNIIDN